MNGEPKAAGSTEGRGVHMEYPPVLNGLDYLLSVVDLLSGAPGPRELKYAVLHLQAGTEVLLKARLLREHWSLVVNDPGKASWDKYNSGDFVSCGTEEAIHRLRKIVRLDISDAQARAVAELSRTRNALQHYGLTRPVPAVKAQAVRVLDFLLDFISEHMQPRLHRDQVDEFYLENPEAIQIGRAMVTVRSRLRDIEAFVTARFAQLQDELSPHLDRTVACHHCGQLALVAGGEWITCRFCRETAPAEHAADEYASFVLNRDELGHEHCPDCRRKALVVGAQTAAAPGQATMLCFACGKVFAVLVDCDVCGGSMMPGESRPHVCDACVTP